MHFWSSSLVRTPGSFFHVKFFDDIWHLNVLRSDLLEFGIWDSLADGHHL